ncbi:MAG: hypothetical protein ACK55Z_03070, partial [bacterium]
MNKCPCARACSGCRQGCADQSCRLCKQCRRFHDNDLCVFEHPETKQEEENRLEEEKRLEQETIGDFNKLVHEDNVLCVRKIDRCIANLLKRMREEKCARIFRCRCSRTGVPMTYCVNGTE